jgi:hypothetical protein
LAIIPFKAPPIHVSPKVIIIIIVTRIFNEEMLYIYNLGIGFVPMMFIAFFFHHYFTFQLLNFSFEIIGNNSTLNMAMK